MKKFLDEADLKDVSKILKKHLEISLEDYVRKNKFKISHRFDFVELTFH